MSIEENVDVIGQSLTSIKNAIIAKGVTPSGNVTTYAAAIGQITTGEEPVLQAKTLEVGSTTATETVLEPDSGYDALSSVTVDMAYIEDELDDILGEEDIPAGRKYYKYVEVNYSTPNMTSNTTDGVTVGSSFSAYTRIDHGGADTWYGFATTSGYVSPYYIGVYRDEAATAMYLYITFDEGIELPKITGYTFYTPLTSSSSQSGGPCELGSLAVSDDGSTWEVIDSHGSIPNNTTSTFTLPFPLEYRYYRYYMKSYGRAYRDQINVSSFHLLGTIITVVESTSDDYDFYVDP